MAEGKPIQLVYVDPKSNELCANEEGLKALAGFTPPYNILSITGTARRGKTTLLNILLGNPAIPFKTSSSTEACTAGVWVWSKQVQIGDKQVILVDTEGTEKGNDTNLAKFITFASIVASVLVLNVDVDINNTTLKQLSIMTSMTSLLEGDNKRALFPTLLFLVRNKQLDFKINNAEVSPQEYIQQVMDGDEDDSDGLNNVRSAIRTAYGKRIISWLSTPSSQQIAQFPKLVANEDFAKDFAELKKTIIKELKPKEFIVGKSNSNVVQIQSGKALCEFVKGCITGLQNNKVKILDIGTTLQQTVANELMQASINAYLESFCTAMSHHVTLSLKEFSAEAISSELGKCDAEKLNDLASKITPFHQQAVAIAHAKFLADAELKKLWPNIINDSKLALTAKLASQQEFFTNILNTVVARKQVESSQDSLKKKQAEIENLERVNKQSSDEYQKLKKEKDNLASSIEKIQNDINTMRTQAQTTPHMHHTHESGGCNVM